MAEQVYNICLEAQLHCNLAPHSGYAYIKFCSKHTK